MAAGKLAGRLAGPGAGVRKYDLLTALAVAGLAGAPSFQTSMTRLIALITARYNWRLDEVSIGQAELARLWSVDLRTVKREVKRLREHGLLLVKRAGVRGRVCSYTLDHARVDELTVSTWPLVGPDFQDRMDEARGRGVAPMGGGNETVVPFPGRHTDEPAASSVWGQARRLLRDADAARYTAWFAPLVCLEQSGNRLVLRAPTEFHANYVTTHLIGELHRAAALAEPGVTHVAVEGSAG